MFKVDVDVLVVFALDVVFGSSLWASIYPSQMATPSDLWMGYLEEASATGGVPASCPSVHLWISTMRYTILARLQQDGFATPSRSSLLSTLEAGLEPLETVPWSSSADWVGKICSFANFLNLLWLPIINHIEALGRDEDPQWTERLGRNQSAILSEMLGIVPSADESLGTEPWVEFLQSTLARLLKVHVPTRLMETEGLRGAPQGLRGAPGSLRGPSFLRS